MAPEGPGRPPTAGPSRPLRWDRDGPHWPGSAASRFVRAGGLRWHLQCHGQGPVLLLLHGTGASGHSWRDVVPGLASRHTVLVPDLPGHGFSEALPTGRATLPGMAAALQALVDTIGLAPAGIAGHSAGAAIAAQMALAPAGTVRRLAWINPALQPFDGWAGLAFGPLARWMARRPALASLAAWRGRDPQAVRSLVESTGSTLDEAGLALYGRLIATPSHVAGALAMMAGWDLAPLRRALPALRAPVLLLVGDTDRTVPPGPALRLAATLPTVQVQHWPGLGHLAHEEAPQDCARRLLDWFGPAAAPQAPGASAARSPGA
ncbi:alpha/beta fold hydrolase BchO [Piscinibacter sakaiensis]|uniref:Putative hydrolase n=1 Tax=Piscinibacter sakaiensis TaxID=1547922 RepID=A0A0K8NVH8_PISS1|nr:alpha/beta fold hydrolase BchO [Piscinibacter sakaiensis]GAP34401.1 putative hydrolase [Piscinibacter sakaiensis]